MEHKKAPNVHFKAAEIGPALLIPFNEKGSLHRD